MPYRAPGGSRSSHTSMRTLRRSGSTLNNQTDYGYQGTGTLRHEFRSQHDSEFVSNTLASGKYQMVDMLRFKRSFSTTVPDVPPTPTNGNNYQTSTVFNGSLVRDFSKIFTIKSLEGTDNNTSLKSFTLDIYQLAFSFWDAFIYEEAGNAPGLDPITDFDNIASSENAGEVEFDSTPTLFTANGVKNSKFIQHYVKLIGSVEIGPGQSVNLAVNRIPAKCRRANSGMFWGLIFHNDTIKNNGAAFNGAINSETSFKEIPTDNRLSFYY